MDRWHCSLDELLSKHTWGQLVVIGAGAVLLDRYSREQAEKEAKRDRRRGRRRGGDNFDGADNEVVRRTIPKAEWKEMTPEQYEAYLRGALGKVRGLT